MIKKATALFQRLHADKKMAAIACGFAPETTATKRKLQ
jgi:hypothetical protein